ncbi:MAG: glycosyltransferase family 2 protein [Bacteroidales bacterium]|nr:glycosyltransferase family 2 protein [Bacteroidales bacterium]MBN2758823.1 glycosyltransferase family 2 protein [Bacteroidales bacterium]
MKAKVKTSLIITTYNWKEALKLTLDSVFMQNVLPDEIIIADDGSSSDTKDMIKEYAKKSQTPIIHSWQEDKGFRLAASRNRAIAISKYEYIIIIDGDIILHPKFIDDHIRLSEKEIYLQGSRVLLNEESSKKMLENQKFERPHIFSRKFKNRINFFYSPLLAKLFYKTKTNSHNGVRGCNFSFFKSDIIKINGFNEDFNSWGREDSEFVERLFNIGVQRRNLKFRGVQYHLFHNEGKANSFNDSILNKAINEKLKWCENGIDKHLKK